MKRNITLVLVALFAAVTTASAAKVSCSVHPKKGATKEDLSALAKVTKEDAQKAALATLKDPSKGAVKDAELEAEHGCLVYSFDIAVAGQSGIQEVQIDAGNGTVLSNEHESPKAEAAENAKDKPKQ